MLTTPLANSKLYERVQAGDRLREVGVPGPTGTPTPQRARRQDPGQDAEYEGHQPRHRSDEQGAAEGDNRVVRVESGDDERAEIRVADVGRQG